MSANSKSLSYLRRVPAFSALPTSAIAALALADKFRTHTRRTILHSPGDDAEHVYVLHDGRVSSLCELTTGRRINFGYFGPGDIFGESCLWSPGPRDDTAVVTIPVLVSVLPRAALRLVLDEHPETERRVVAHSIARRDATARRLGQALGHSVRARLASQLLERGEHGRDTRHGRELDFQIRQHELAALIVSTRETVTLELGRFERDRLIFRRGRQIFLRDIQRLSAIARDDPPVLRTAAPAPIPLRCTSL